MDVLIRLVNALLMLLIPLFLGVYLQRQFKLGWGLLFAGALGFVASQVMHIPFNQLVLRPLLDGLGLNGSESSRDLLLISLALGFSAGFFEEPIRYLVYRFGLREARSWEAGVTYGAGWGGVESALLGALAMIGLYQALAFRNADLSGLVPADQLAQTAAELANYWGIPWYGALLGALERVFAIIIQISLSVIVLQAFLRRNWLWLPLAIGWHATVNAVGLFALGSWGPYWAEGLIGLTALVSLAVLFVLRPGSGECARSGEDAEPSEILPQMGLSGSQPELPMDEAGLDSEALDETRFSG